MKHRYSELARFYQRGKQGGRLRVAFLGGSITWGATASDPLKTSWRALVQEHFEKRFPNAHIKGIDAAIGGTPSELGVFRMDRDVLPHRPDLTFVEFSVNDGDKPTSQETMEGIVRKLRKSNPRMAIVLVIIGGGYDYKGSRNREKHIELADYYGLPYVDVCGAVEQKVRKGLDTRKILHDGCHPNDAGYRLYAEIIIRALGRMNLEQGALTAWPVKALTANRYESASMVELAKVADLGGWEPIVPAVVGTWFDHQPSRWFSSAVSPRKKNSRLALDLRCRGLGLYYQTVRDGGTIVLEAEGKPVIKVSTAMDMPEARVDFSIVMFEDSRKRRLRLVAGQCDKTTVAYLFYL